MAALRSLLESPEQTFIIVDALDECPRDNRERTTLLEVLRELSVWALPNVHILVTSRREPDIERELVLIITIPPVCIQTKVVDADIHLHVQNQLSNDENLKKWSSEIKAEIKKVLVEGADGM